MTGLNINGLIVELDNDLRSVDEQKIIEQLRQIPGVRNVTRIEDLPGPGGLVNIAGPTWP